MWNAGWNCLWKTASNRELWVIRPSWCTAVSFLLDAKICRLLTQVLMTIFISYLISSSIFISNDFYEKVWQLFYMTFLGPQAYSSVSQALQRSASIFKDLIGSFMISKNFPGLPRIFQIFHCLQRSSTILQDLQACHYTFKLRGANLWVFIKCL